MWGPTSGRSRRVTSASGWSAPTAVSSTTTTRRSSSVPWPCGRTRCCCAAGRSRRASATGPCRPASWNCTSAPRPPRRGKRGRRRGPTSRCMSCLRSTTSRASARSSCSIAQPSGSPAIEPGPESTEVRLFGWDELPEDEYAFPSVHWALQHYREIAGETAFAIRTNPPSPPTDGTAYSSPKQEQPRG